MDAAAVELHLVVGEGDDLDAVPVQDFLQAAEQLVADGSNVIVETVRAVGAHGGGRRRDHHGVAVVSSAVLAGALRHDMLHQVFPPTENA